MPAACSVLSACNAPCAMTATARSSSGRGTALTEPRAHNSSTSQRTSALGAATPQKMCGLRVRACVRMGRRERERAARPAWIGAMARTSNRVTSQQTRFIGAEARERRRLKLGVGQRRLIAAQQQAEETRRRVRSGCKAQKLMTTPPFCVAYAESKKDRSNNAEQKRQLRRTDKRSF